MKRWKIIISSSLIAMPSLPLMTVVSCNNDTPNVPYEGNLAFNLNHEEQTAEIIGFNGQEISHEEVVIPSRVFIDFNLFTVTSIAVDAFKNHGDIKTVTFEKNSNLVNINVGAFADCGGLTSVNLPKSLQNIGDNAFQNCQNLQSINFEENSSLERLGNLAFLNCTHLSTLNLPNKISFIGERTFSNTNLSTLSLPKTITSIGTWAFSSASLKKIFYEGTRAEFEKIRMGTTASEPSPWMPFICKDEAFNILSGGTIASGYYYRVSINGKGRIDDVNEVTIDGDKKLVITYNPNNKEEAIILTQNGSTLIERTDYRVDRVNHTITISESKWNQSRPEYTPILFNIDISDPILAEGSTRLFGQVGSDDSDTNKWLLKKGSAELPAALEIIDYDGDDIFIENGVIKWTKSLKQGTYHFRIKAIYKKLDFFSDEITLTIGPVVTSFVDDPWSLVAWWANQGLDALHKVYKYECDNNPDTDFTGTLVGYTRNLNLNPSITSNINTYKVMVIGENQDNLRDYPAALAPLTFQFVDVISDQNSNTLESYRALKGNSRHDLWHYWDSNIDNNLNRRNGSSAKVSWYNQTNVRNSVLQMIIDGGELKSGDIKYVYRKANESNDEGITYTTQEKYTKVFMLTLSDIYSEKGMKKTSLIKEEDIPYLFAENERGQAQYLYFAKKVGDSSCDTPLEIFKKHSLNPFNYASYWISSNLFSSKTACMFDQDGKLVLSEELDDDSHYAVAPCFCI